MIELHYWPTPNGHKVTLFLEEAGLDYANISLVVNWAAGVEKGTINLHEIENHLSVGIVDVLHLIEAWLLNIEQ